jgi:hypothetical protein
MRGARKHRERGKARERQVAAFFGTTRTPLSGGNSRHTASDTLHARLFIEVKERAPDAHGFTAGLFRLVDATEELADAEGKIPVLAIAEKGRPGFLVVCYVDDLATVAAELAAGAEKCRQS